MGYINTKNYEKEKQNIFNIYNGIIFNGGAFVFMQQ